MDPTDLDVEDFDGELAKEEEAINAERQAWIEHRKTFGKRKEEVAQQQKDKKQRTGAPTAASSQQAAGQQAAGNSADPRSLSFSCA